MAVGEDVYCTLVMSDAYLPGAAVLAESLRDTGTNKKLACLITQDSLRASTITELQTLYNYVIPIDRIGTPNPANLYLMNRPDLLYTFTKINLWRLTQFRKVVYVDSDVVALRAPDELFEIQEDFAAAPDVGWPDAFNTGVMVLTPHMGEYWALRTLAAAGDSFDGADQGLLNQYYEHRPWRRLNFTYNCTPSANYQYEPAYRYYKRDISMVHFIGSDKPWQQGRSAKSSPNAYQELLGRWWAVYDRHFRVSTYEYTATGQREHRAVQQEVNESQKEAYYATGYPAASTEPAGPPGMPMTEPEERGELISQGVIEPTPTVQQRKFSAPSMEWDATRAAPPSQSKPEAANFPTTTYEFNTDTGLFRPPPAYPEPPKNMWFEVPKEKPKKEVAPPPIFPWEERGRPVATRRFVEEEPAPPEEPEPEPESDFVDMDEFGVSADNEKDETKAPSIQVNDGTPWQSFGSMNKNAWDDVSGINDYVHAFVTWQKSRSKSSSTHAQESSAAAAQQQIMSPTAEPSGDDLVSIVQKRRESLLLTDFPSAVERPSLPVTPAPRRRPTFWGGERDEVGDLPAAEGVPDQADWDPSAQLEELRRSSLIDASDLKLPAKKQRIPSRDMPSSSALTPEEVHGHSGPTGTISGGSSPHGLDQLSQPVTSSAASASGMTGTAAFKDAAERNAAKAAPTFTEPVFDTPSSSGAAKAESALSPTER